MVVAVRETALNINSPLLSQPSQSFLMNGEGAGGILVMMLDDTINLVPVFPDCLILHISVISNMLPPSLHNELISLDETIADTQSLIQELRQAINGTRDPIELRRYGSDIKRLQGYVNEYSQRYQDLCKVLSTAEQSSVTDVQQVQNKIQVLHDELQQVAQKIDSVVNGQVLIFRSLRELRQELLGCYEAGEQRIIQRVVETFNQQQMQLAQAMLSTLNQLSPDQMEEILNLFEYKLLPVLPPSTNEAVAIIKNENLDIQHRLQVAIPLFPLELKDELELGTDIDLLTALEKSPQEIWRKIITILRCRR